MIKLKQLLTEEKSILTLYHGTTMKYLSNIKSKGLIRKSYDSAQWYMLASDFDSALFHANPDKNGGNVVVVEFKVPATNERWEGYPYLWPPTKRSSKSKWYALKQALPKKFIKKIHQVNYEDWIKQKEKGF